MGDLEPDAAAPRQVIGTARAWAPYGVLAGILVLTRIPDLGLQSLPLVRVFINTGERTRSAT